MRKLVNLCASRQLLQLCSLHTRRAQSNIYRDPVDSLRSFRIEERTFTPAQTDKLLSIINNATQKDLEQVPGINETLVNSILTHRSMNGKFDDLNALFNLDDGNSKIIESICLHLIRKGENENYGMQFVIPRKSIVPKFESPEIPSSIVSCNLQLTSLSWLHMSSNLTVLDWQHRPLFDPQRLRFDHVKWHKVIRDVIEELPDPTETSLYLMEEQQLRATNISQAPSLISRARLDSIFTTILAMKLTAAGSREEDSYLYKLKPSVTNNHFSLEIGGQRVGGRQVIWDIKRGLCAPGRGVQIPSAFMSLWRDQSSTNQELMGNTLLTAVSFYKQFSSSDDNL